MENCAKLVNKESYNIDSTYNLEPSDQFSNNLHQSQYRENYLFVATDHV